MSFNRDDYRIIRASDISGDSDEIGVEIYRGKKLLIEIFRDDTKRTREITTAHNQFSLEEMEGFIQIFKAEIPWDFIEYDEQE